MNFRSMLMPVLSLVLALSLGGCDEKAKPVSSCGDDFLDPGEECDRTVFAVPDCEALGFYEQSGALTCRADCTVERAACSLYCGDDLIQGAEGEQCDGTNLNGQTCAARGYTNGVLACDATCQYDLSGCVTCGDGVTELGEACDDGGNEPQDGCSALCQVEVGWACAGTPSVCEPICGDSRLVGDEVCDTLEFGELTCESLGYYGGELVCTAACEPDLLACEANGICGDDLIQAAHGEQCDAANLDGATCHTRSFWTGALGCTGACAFDTADCLGIVSAAAGGRFTCVVLTDGTVRCWGRNQRGQLGDGTTTDSLVPVTVAGLTNVASLGLGGSHACAVLTDGTLKCWGYNGYGQLGIGSIVDQSTATTVPGLTGVHRVSGGERHACAALTDGTVRCWGFNGSGRLGDGTTTDRTSPVAVSGLTGIRDVSAGGNHTCAVNTPGYVYCWGLGTSGQLGNNGIVDSLLPVRAGTLTGADAVHAGYYHTCVHVYSSQNTDGGTAYCWGQNGYGQLGDGVINHGTTCMGADCSRLPVAIPGYSGAIAQLALTGYSTCLRTDTGQAWCWGMNTYGQVGDGTTTTRMNPVQLSTLPGASALWPSFGSHVCASRAGSPDLFCWGMNDYGQVGDGTTVNATAPLTVVAP